VFRENFYTLYDNQTDKWSTKNAIFTKMTCHCDDKPCVFLIMITQDLTLSGMYVLQMQ